MKEMSALDFFVENAAEYITTGNRRVGKGTVVILSSVTGSTVEMVDAVKKAQADGAKYLALLIKKRPSLRKWWTIVFHIPPTSSLSSL